MKREMNLVDWLLIMVIALGVWSGWQRGFMAAMADLLSWTGSLLIGFYTYQYFAGVLDRITKLGPWTFPIAFVLLVLISRILFFVFLKRLYQFEPLNEQKSKLNHALGTVPGMIKGCMYAILVAGLLLATPLMTELATKAKDSRIAGLMSPEVDWLQEKLSPLFETHVGQPVNNLVAQPESDATIKLKFTDADAPSRPDLETKMIGLVNEERKRVGLTPLVADPQLTSLARSHSKDMLSRGYFSHYTPEGKDPFERMREARIPFRSAGENLAFGATLKIAHRGLMESQGHKENILRPSFRRIGIGVLDGGRYGLMITQEFKN